MRSTLVMGMALVCLAFSSPSMAQVLTNDKEQASSLKYPGGAVSFDITEANIGFQFSQLGNATRKKTDRGRFWSVQANGKAQEGTTALFSDGDFSPEGKVQLLYGYCFTDEVGQTATNLQAARAACDGLTQQLGALAAALPGKLDQAVSLALVPLQGETVLKPKVAEAVKATYADPDKDKSLKAMKAVILDNTNEAAMLIRAQLAMQKEFDQYEQQRANLMNQRSVAFDQIAKVNPVIDRFLLYGELTGRALSFKHVGDIDTTDVSKSFSDQEFQGAEGRIGFNYWRGGRWHFGAAFGLAASENQATLKKIDYNLRTTYASGNQQLITEQKVTAYKGEFKTFTQMTFSADVLWFGRISDKAILGVGPYYRHYTPADLSIMPTYSDAGLTFNFFKPDGTFSGGFYFEAHDIGSSISKFTAAEENKEVGDLKPFYQRLTIGIVAKINIASTPLAASKLGILL